MRKTELGVMRGTVWLVQQCSLGTRFALLANQAVPPAISVNPQNRRCSVFYPGISLDAVGGSH